MTSLQQTHGTRVGAKTKKTWVKIGKNVWIGQIFIFMYLCIFLPHFGLGWYSVVQYCIASLAKGKSAASSFNENNVT